MRSNYMSISKTLCVLLSSTILFGCLNTQEIEPSESMTTVKFAQFNVSFAHDGDPSENFEQWVEFMNIEPQTQNRLINSWLTNALNEDEKKLAERIIQIRNIAAIIQQVRPDVLLLNEFNNDGTGQSREAIDGFQKNYLSQPQSLNSVNSGNLQRPIYYPFKQSYATNTGLHAGIDLNNNGLSKADPNDAYGFGFYHGHYAFALFSKYKIDTENTRTFQTFKRKDLPSAIMPVVNVCKEDKPLPDALQCGDNWFNEEQWEALRLSSKNHVDAPIIIPTPNGKVVINALLAHPTPPAFDTFSDNNKYRNSEENLFWLHYIQGEHTLYDDNKRKGGFNGEHFVLMGDLNADATTRTGADERFNGINQLMSHALVNQDVSQANGEFAPASLGGLEANSKRPHPMPATRTSTFGVRADYAVPSASLKVIESGVYWQAKGAEGELLFNDSRIGKRGSDKEVSSDHRLVWATVQID